MRPPLPRSLLVEHPALPQPFEQPDPDGSPIPVGALDRSDRFAVAVQMVAVTALLADFELWPGRWALRRSRVEMTGEGPRVRLPSLPSALSSIWSRLGSGDPAAETTRSAVLATIADLTRLDAEVFEPDGREPGFFLDGVLTRLLGELDRPLDGATARSLWMWRWALPAEPEIGDTTLLAFADERVARRLGAAIWAAASRRGDTASFEIVRQGHQPVFVAGRKGQRGIRIFAGTIDESILASIIDGGGDADVGTVVLGRFPKGWDPIEAPVFDADRLAVHLSVAGISPARRARFVDGQTGRFDPFSPADRRSLTRSAATLFADPRRRSSGRFGELVRVAGLAPEGLPIEGFLGLTGLAEADLDTACSEGVVIRRQGWVMVGQPTLMRVDPRHADLVDLYDPDDPRRVLHEALASGNPGSLLDWAHGRVDDLDGVAVRSLLGGLATGTLGPGPQLALAHACLGLADIHGARRALAGLSEDLARPWSSWLRLMDRAPDLEVSSPRPVEIRQAPRACAEIALVGVRRALRWNTGSAEAPVQAVRDALTHLRGLERRWVEIRLAALVEPDKLADVEWRRAATGGHPELTGLIIFERSIRATVEGRSRLAKRLLRRVMSTERSPGRRALMLVNLGILEADDGRHAEAEALTLGAFRLFQAAGSRHRVWDVLFNLAVTDIDQLRVDRASARLDEVAESEHTLFVEVERARLALAIGDLDEFCGRLVGLPEVEEVSRPEIVEALSFLYGAESLFFDSAEAARPLFDAGGREGSVWLELADALTGRPDVQTESTGDGWGNRRVAAIVRALRDERSSTPLDGIDLGSLALRDALSVALCRQLAVRPGWPDRGLRLAAAEVLARRGLTGWSGRTRWDAGEVEEVFKTLSTLVRSLATGRLDESGFEGILDVLGITGLVVYAARDRHELLRVGGGDPAASYTRGALEMVPLGTRPIPDPVWDLLGNLLELTLPTGTQRPPPRDPSEVRIDGVSAAAGRLRDEVQRAAGPRFTVLVHGETGSGKEVVARELHRLSGRTGELVSVNIAAVPANLLEAELFGSVKGAFTGAQRTRKGLVAAADGGSLFLDEVGDLDVALQVKLLRFLESGEVRPVGSDQTRHLDVRVICATHRNLERRVRAGRFREDLYFRMAVAKVEVPALRDRIEDLPILRAIFEDEATRRDGLQASNWSAAAESRLMHHGWPGNVRELKYTVEVAMARASGGEIRPEHLPFRGRPSISRGSWEHTLAGFKRRFLTEVLTRNLGNRSAAARDLGISRQALLYQLKKLDLTDL